MHVIVAGVLSVLSVFEAGVLFSELFVLEESIVLFCLMWIVSKVCDENNWFAEGLDR